MELKMGTLGRNEARNGANFPGLAWIDTSDAVREPCKQDLTIVTLVLSLSRVMTMMMGDPIKSTPGNFLCDPKVEGVVPND